MPDPTIVVAVLSAAAVIALAIITAAIIGDTINPDGADAPPWHGEPGCYLCEMGDPHQVHQTDLEHFGLSAIGPIPAPSPPSPPPVPIPIPPSPPGGELVLPPDLERTTDLTSYVEPAPRGGRHRLENITRVDATYRPLVNARFASFMAASTPSRGEA